MISQRKGLKKSHTFIYVYIATWCWQIVIDEIHLLTDFGRSFRMEITLLKYELFNKVKETKPMLF